MYGLTSLLLVTEQGRKEMWTSERSSARKFYIGILQVSTYLLGGHPFMAPLSFVPSIRNGDKASEAGHLLGGGKVRQEDRVKPIP